MSLHAHDPRPDPELWRAVHERPAAPVSSPFVCPSDSRASARTVHGMPADRLAMAASLPATERRSHHRSV